MFERIKKFFGPSKAQLLQELKLTRMEAEVRQTRLSQENIKLREAFPGGWSPSYPGFGVLVNPLQAYYDGLQPLFSPVPAIYDYTLNLGFFVTEAWLDLLRMASKTWFSTQPQPRGVIEALTDYVIHTGFEYQVIAKPGQRVAKDLVDDCQKVVDKFLCKNAYFMTEIDFYTRQHRDGEAFGELFPQEDAVTILRTIEGWQIRAPGKLAQGNGPEWLFGVHTDPGDREQVIGYNKTLTGDVGDGVEVGADRMAHFKMNVDRFAKRGVSSFLCTQGLFSLSQKLLSNTLQGESVRQAIAWIEQYTGAPEANLPTPLQSDTPVFDSSLPPSFGQTPPDDVYEPGSVPRIDAGTEFKNGPIGSTANSSEILMQAYRAISVFFRVPEWLVSGFSDANFAQALVQESPLVRRCQRDQKVQMHHHKGVLHMVLRIAEDQGELPEGACDKVDFNVEAPPLVVRDPLKETTRNEKLAKAKLLSKETWSVREDLDYEAEQDGIARDGPVEFAPDQADGKPQGDESQTPGAEYQRLTNGRN